MLICLTLMIIVLAMLLYNLHIFQFLTSIVIDIEMIYKYVQVYTITMLTDVNEIYLCVCILKYICLIIHDAYFSYAFSICMFACILSYRALLVCLVSVYTPVNKDKKNTQAFACVE